MFSELQQALSLAKGTTSSSEDTSIVSPEALSWTGHGLGLYKVLHLAALHVTHHPG